MPACLPTIPWLLLRTLPRRILFLGVGCLALAAGPSRAQDHPSCPFIYGETQFPDAFEPITSLNSLPAIRISSMLFCGLIRFDEFREAQPALASSWSFNEDNSALDITLSPGLLWHDGQPLTTRDVKFTVDLLLDRSNFISPFYRRKAQTITRVVVQDDLKLRIELGRSFPQQADALARLDFPILPEHVLRDTGLKRGGAFSTERPVGNGPYRLASIELAENKVSLQANPAFFAPTSIPEVVLRKRANQELLALGLQGGGLDFIADISPDRLQPFYRSVEFDIYPYESLSFEGIAINFKNRHLAVKEVRTAMLLSIDRQRILDEQYGDHGQVLSGPFAHTSYCFSDTVSLQPYRPDLAADLLEKAGYLDRDSDGVRESPTGSRLSFQLKVAAHDDRSSDFAVCQRIASFLADAGFEISIVKLTRDDFEYEVHVEREFDLAFFAWAYDEGSNVGPLFVTSEEYPEFDRNYGSYNNPVFSKTYFDWREAPDRIQAQTFGWEMHRMLADDLPYLFLWNLEKYAITSRRVANVTLSGITTFSLIDQWVKACE